MTVTKAILLCPGPKPGSPTAGSTALSPTEMVCGNSGNGNAGFWLLLL